MRPRERRERSLYLTKKSNSREGGERGMIRGGEITRERSREAKTNSKNEK